MLRDSFNISAVIVGVIGFLMIILASLMNISSNKSFYCFLNNHVGVIYCTKDDASAKEILNARSKLLRDLNKLPEGDDKGGCEKTA